MRLSLPIAHHADGRRLELQGLRGVAILSVLLFHVWPSRLPAGYLGVDVFFVISGFLMCSLLDAKKPLGLSATLQFYFQRVRRIIPTYLFVILVFLLLALFFVSPTDYRDLRAELKKPLLYVANRPETASSDYFTEMEAGYAFFAHLWSLSVELQFYLFVPLLVFCLHRVSVCFQLLSITLLADASFYFQHNSTGDVEHMSLEGRVWQFLAGFAAFHLQQAVAQQPTAGYFLLAKYDEKSGGKEARTIFRWLSTARKTAAFVLPFVLLLLLFGPLVLKKVAARLLVIGVTTAVIGLSDAHFLLSCRPLVFLGDVSYSVYLVHFSLFKWHDYRFVATTYDSVHTSVAAGVCLMTAAIAGGWAVERLFKRVTSLLTNWTRLLLLIAFFYALIGSTLVALEKRQDDEPDAKWNDRLKQPQRLMRDTIAFYNHFNTMPVQLDRKQLVEYNKLFYPAALHPWYCKGRGHPPTDYRGPSNQLTGNGCTISRPNGTKNIVVFGNSHTPTLLAGIIHHFRDVYRTIVPLYRFACQFVGAKNENPQYALCPRERAALIPMLKAWKFPIDIIIGGIGYTSLDHPLRSANLSEDSIFVEMQAFFSELSEIAREMVFIPQMHYHNGVTPYRKILMRKLMLGEPLDVFRTPYDAVATYKPNNRRRLAAVRCPKCVPYSYMDVFCNKTAGICDAVDRKQRFAFFYNEHHPSLYGSFFIGRRLRELYDRQMSESERSFASTSSLASR